MTVKLGDVVKIENRLALVTGSRVVTAHSVVFLDDQRHVEGREGTEITGLIQSQVVGQAGALRNYLLFGRERSG